MGQWERVEAIFHGALQRPPAERDSWLRQACGSDPELLREVRSLVSNHPGDSPTGWAAAAAAELVTGTCVQVGQRIGPYELLELIGTGGMGEVYRARDTRLGREVALKLLPIEFAEDSERLARFKREAQLLASLNHPNIAALYAVEDGAFVMELVEGTTLAEHMTASGMDPAEALSIMKQVAEALEYAHERGIIHRDLKPANIRLTPEGRVKVLDFGLAKALGGAAVGSPPSSPVLTGSGAGVGIIGTAAYMPPEQARGMAVDKRADVWSFGVVLYELLARRRAFAGETVAETLASVLKTDPDWSALPPETAPAICRLLRRCLERDRRSRLRDMGDAIIEIDEALAAASASKPVAPTPVGSKRRILRNVLVGAMALMAIALLVTATVLWRISRRAEPPLIRLNIDLGPELVTGTSSTVVISRDGRRLVFPIRGASGNRQLATRVLDERDATLLAGTENATDPFFSPDGEWLAFFADGKLKKMSVHGGAPVTLCASVTPRGGSWGEDHNIVAALNFAGPLWRLPDAGGKPQALTRLGSRETTHRWPQVLPGGDAILFTASPHPIWHEDADIEVLSLKTGETKLLLHGGYFGRYLPSGHLLYVHQGVLFGVGFDASRLEVRGTPTPLMEDGAANPVTGAGQFDFSEAPSGAGTFLYLAGSPASQKWRVDWLDHSGNVHPLIASPGVYTVPRLSPDGNKLAFIGIDAAPQIYDLQSETIARITSAAGSGNLVWARDNKHVVFGKGGGLYWVRSDGVGAPQRLLASQTFIAAWSFSPDGRWLAYFEPSADTGSDIWVLPLDTADADQPKVGKPIPFLRTQGDERFPTFSPDGHWIAYNSDESGNDEIWVRPFPAATKARYQISAGRGMYPLWSNSRNELFYETTDHRIMVVDYRVEGDLFKPGKPRVWSDYEVFYPGVSNVDIAPDGRRFAILAPVKPQAGEQGAVRVTMLLNYFGDLKRRIPTAFRTGAK